ncbi:MAG: DUF885 domain-containing protein [Flavobacteriaceae bacterium]
MKYFNYFLLGFLCLQCDQKTASDDLNDLILAYENFEAYDRELFPLGDFSEQRFKKEADFWATTLDRLNALAVDQLSQEELISFELFQFVLEANLSAFGFKTHYNPILSDAGFHNNLVYRVRPISTLEEAADYLALLKAIPLFVEQNMALIQKGIDQGISQPKVIFNGYENTYEQHITPTAEDNFYFSPFLNLPQQWSKEVRDSLFSEAKTVVKRDVVPSFQKIKGFFEKNYLPNTREEIGVSSTPNGTAYYNNRIAYYTTLSLSAQEIHQTGLEEVEKISAAMKAIIAEVGFNGSFADFFTYLRTNPRFNAKTPDELLMRARDISKRLDEQLPRFFKTLPRKPYGVAAVPDAIAPKYTGGRYIPTSPESNDPGYYWVNTYDLPSRPLYVLPALSAHEAVPGHHLQMALNAELPKTIPAFRRDLYLSAYGEGWGLYTESLAAEMGIYTTPYERFGQLTYSMWRACRLVVDTGIHAFGWSRAEAVTFMAENTALSLHEINTEVDRYISWPGQALAYKIGELKIKALREKATNALGEDFDIREFHELILGKGTLTLPLMEKEVEHYIAQYKNE